MNYIIFSTFFIITVLIKALVADIQPKVINSVPKIVFEEFEALSVVEVRASSELHHQDSAGVLMQYSANNLLDTTTNAWVEGVPGYGIHETIEFQLPVTAAPHIISVLNGYIKSSRTWRENARIKELHLLVNQKSIAILKLKDTWKTQYFYLSKEIRKKLKDRKDKSNIFIFKIMNVYKGTKYKDAAITSIAFFQEKQEFTKTLIIVIAVLLTFLFIFVVFVIANSIRTKSTSQLAIVKRNRAKDNVLLKLQKLADQIYKKFEYEIIDYCIYHDIDTGKSKHVFTILKFAEQHAQLKNVCNYDILHEIRQYRNRLAHPNQEYHHESTETLLHYEDVLDKELNRLQAYIEESY